MYAVLLALVAATVSLMSCGDLARTAAGFRRVSELAATRLVTPTDDALKEMAAVGWKGEAAILARFGPPDFRVAEPGGETWWYRCGDAALDFWFEGGRVRYVGHCRPAMLYEIVRQSLRAEDAP